MKKRGLTRAAVSGAIIFFVLVASVVTVAMTVYSVIIRESDNRTVVVFGMLGVVLFLSALCTIADWIRRKIQIERPVKKILDGTDKIASGDFSVRIETVHSFGQYDEYDRIINNFNKMAAELSRTEVLHTDFISNVSHEMKTPLAVIQNYATSLQNKSLDEETRIKYAETLASAAKRLTALVTNILKLNKLENQEIKTQYEEINLTESLAQTVLGFEDLIESKNLNLDCDLDEDIKIVSMPSYLEIVWNNLLSNAIKFTEAGGTVGVSLKQTENKVIVSVSDTGCGISEETGRRIFDKFYQGDTSHSQEGNGLGLALVKKVIDIVGGEISVESELGKGTTFTITLNAGNFA